MPPAPLILAFDTSAAHCAAALLSGDRLLAARHEEMAKGQAERLMPLLEELLAEGGAGWRDLARIGVGIGPGNFTGIRIAVPAARGLALALSVPAVGVSGLEAQAFGTEGVVVSSLDGRRGALHVQVFGTGASEPLACTLETLPEVAGRPVCIGHGADEIAAALGGTVAEPRFGLAEAMARIAAVRTPVGRPAPLYLRGADAAPPREAPPAILP
ncbi:tRNA (adenosine(37)-N6)-threonylcarbamoyltransferase complex dimerization subunit type 1 TsaB [Oceaniglobus roseus]|uniref:tRNA (adenosine(37)-N6)-threonylcarbamoyltransferase complex dimerization subunit type 1 TsaB n=1 Tax=Oceaniglobus roseus TaxID=1737570 RepID=UPI000C7EE73C|nr:tRNA (adenosine(37)-N6)-threonylcarbamoyltransferase complex dimerization subunit type 1 TsaB [Kandeliimicrobium roseum]